jgi:hypothetical protein
MEGKSIIPLPLFCYRLQLDGYLLHYTSRHFGIHAIPPPNLSLKSDCRPDV